jgi:hypothetical protein
MGEEVSRTDPFSSHLNVDNKWGGREREASGETPPKVPPTILDSEFVQTVGYQKQKIGK